MTSTPTLSALCSTARFHTRRRPERVTTGALTARWAELLARPLIPWQVDLVDVAGELVPGDDDERAPWHFAYGLVIVVTPRRAGKSLVTLAKALSRLSLPPSYDRHAGAARSWYSAQRREDAAKAFRDDWLPLLEALPPSVARHIRARSSQGSEGLTLLNRPGGRNGGRLQLFPPTATALHGTNADDVTVDEAWSFTLERGRELQAGFGPAQLTRPLHQAWILSAGGTADSTWLDALMSAGQAAATADTGRGVCYVEYSADPDLPGYDPYDPALIAATHPAVGHTVTLEAILADADPAIMDRATFERSYLCVWPRPSGAGADLARWGDLVDVDAVPVDPVAFAFDVDPARSTGAVGVAGLTAEGVPVLELVDARPGVGWLPARLAALCRDHGPVDVVVDPSGPAGALLPDLAELGVPVRLLSGREVTGACGAMFDDVDNGRVKVRPSLLLDAARTAATRQRVAGAWMWHRDAATVPLLAVTFARWAFRQWWANAGAPVVS